MRQRDWPGVVFDCVLVIAASILLATRVVDNGLFAAIVMPIVGAHVVQRRGANASQATGGGSPPSEPPKAAGGATKALSGSAAIGLVVGLGSIAWSAFRAKHQA